MNIVGMILQSEPVQGVLSALALSLSGYFFVFRFHLLWKYYESSNRVWGLDYFILGAAYGTWFTFGLLLRSPLSGIPVTLTLLGLAWVFCKEWESNLSTPSWKTWPESYGAITGGACMAALVIFPLFA